MPGPRPLPEDTFANASSQPISASAPLALVPTWVPSASARSFRRPARPAAATEATVSPSVSSPARRTRPSCRTIRRSPSATPALRRTRRTTPSSTRTPTNSPASAATGASRLGLHAGNGGNGVFAGALVAAEVGVFAPVNTAVAGGPDAHADAFQSNAAAFLQGGTQLAGVGGNGGPSYLGDPSGGGLTVNGDLHGGAGGAGTFIGTMTDISVAIYSPSTSPSPAPAARPTPPRTTTSS